MTPATHPADPARALLEHLQWVDRYLRRHGTPRTERDEILLQLRDQFYDLLGANATGPSHERIDAAIERLTSPAQWQGAPANRSAWQRLGSRLNRMLVAGPPPGPLVVSDQGRRRTLWSRLVPWTLVTALATSVATLLVAWLLSQSLDRPDMTLRRASILSLGLTLFWLGIALFTWLRLRFRPLEELSPVTQWPAPTWAEGWRIALKFWGGLLPIVLLLMPLISVAVSLASRLPLWPPPSGSLLPMLGMGLVISILHQLGRGRRRRELQKMAQPDAQTT